jgi:hypothetical protein
MSEVEWTKWDTDTRRLRLGLPWLVGLVAIVAAFAGSASINDRTVAKRVASGDAKALINVATSDPVARATRRAARPKTSRSSRFQRAAPSEGKLDCAGLAWSNR